MEEMLSTLLSNGIAGIMLAFFIWYLTKRDKEHLEERRVWMDSHEEHIAQLANVIKQNTEAFTVMEKMLERSECKFRK